MRCLASRRPPSPSSTGKESTRMESDEEVEGHQYTSSKRRSSRRKPKSNRERLSSRHGQLTRELGEMNAQLVDSFKDGERYWLDDNVVMIDPYSANSKESRDARLYNKIVVTFVEGGSLYLADPWELGSKYESSDNDDDDDQEIFGEKEPEMKRRRAERGKRNVSRQQRRDDLLKNRTESEKKQDIATLRQNLAQQTQEVTAARELLSQAVANRTSTLRWLTALEGGSATEDYVAACRAARLTRQREKLSQRLSQVDLKLQQQRKDGKVKQKRNRGTEEDADGASSSDDDDTTSTIVSNDSVNTTSATPSSAAKMGATSGDSMFWKTLRGE